MKGKNKKEEKMKLIGKMAFWTASEMATNKLTEVKIELTKKGDGLSLKDQQE